MQVKMLINQSAICLLKLQGNFTGRQNKQNSSGILSKKKSEKVLILLQQNRTF